MDHKGFTILCKASNFWYKGTTNYTNTISELSNILENFERENFSLAGLSNIIIFDRICYSDLVNFAVEYLFVLTTYKFSGFFLAKSIHKI